MIKITEPTDEIEDAMRQADRMQDALAKLFEETEAYYRRRQFFLGAVFVLSVAVAIANVVWVIETHWP